jgi:translation initiation factor RLI1
MRGEEKIKKESLGKSVVVEILGGAAYVNTTSESTQYKTDEGIKKFSDNKKCEMWKKIQGTERNFSGTEKEKWKIRI